jgi:hypothetical protein
MTSYEVIEKLNNLLTSLENTVSINEMVRNISHKFPELQGHMSRVFVAENSKTQQNLVENAREHLIKIISEINFVRAGGIFVELFNLKRELQEKRSSIHLLEYFIDNLIEKLDKFHDDYENFVHDQSIKSTIELLPSAFSLNKSLQTLKDVIFAVKNQLLEETPLKINNAALSIFLVSSIS